MFHRMIEIEDVRLAGLEKNMILDYDAILRPMVETFAKTQGVEEEEIIREIRAALDRIERRKCARRREEMDR